MKKLIAALVVVGALVMAATAQAAPIYYRAKCQASTYNHPGKHTIYMTYNGIWKFLAPGCPAAYNYAGAIFRVAYYPNGNYWAIPG